MNDIIKELINESKELSGGNSGNLILPPNYLNNQIFHENPIQKRKRLKVNKKYSPHQGNKEKVRRLKNA